MPMLSIFVLDQEAKKILLSAPKDYCFTSSNKEKQIEDIESKCATLRLSNKIVRFQTKSGPESYFYYYAKACIDALGNTKIAVIVTDEKIESDYKLLKYFSAIVTIDNSSQLQKIINNPDRISQQKTSTTKLKKESSLGLFSFLNCCKKEKTESEEDLPRNYQKLGGLYSIQ